MKNCENCTDEHNGTYGSGRFCSSKCARGFSTKAKRKEINKKVSKAITGSGNDKVKLTCPYCKNEYEVKWKRRKSKHCSQSCASKDLWEDDEYRNPIQQKLKEHYSLPKNRDRLRDIGRSGGFGTRGITNDGTRYESLIEKACYEYLEDSKIPFEAHKYIPNSSKVSDIYLTEYDLWIEVDGINRESKKKWIGKNYDYWIDKLNHYDLENLNYIIVYDVNDLKEIIN